MAESGEDSLIRRYFAPLARDPAALGLADDAAVLVPPEGCDLVLTQDAIVEGVHFLSDDPPDTIAKKALRVNLSDLAAKGARPLGFLLTFGLTAARGEDWIAAFAAGLGADAERFACPLLGGDTVRMPDRVTISITALGAVPAGRMVRRSGAAAGDCLFLSGTVGDAALGLAALRAGAAPEDAPLVARYRVPEPRLALADALQACATAAMDVSDGLAGDLAKLCRASGVSAEVSVEALPLSDRAAQLARHPGAIEEILAGGDDYEILCAVSEARAAAFHWQAAQAGVSVAQIGRIVEGSGDPRFLDPAGQPLVLRQQSYSHF